MGDGDSTGPRTMASGCPPYIGGLPITPPLSICLGSIAIKGGAAEEDVVVLGIATILHLSALCKGPEPFVGDGEASPRRIALELSMLSGRPP